MSRKNSQGKKFKERGGHMRPCQNPAQATCLGKSHLAKASSRQAKTGREMKPELRNRMGRGQGGIRMGFPCTAARSGKGKAHWPRLG